LLLKSSEAAVKMATQELVRCYCSVSVEVGGKALTQDKAAKQVGVQAVQLPTGVTLRVLGFKRDITLSSRNLRTIVDSKIEEGRLAFVGRDNMQVVISKAQPTQLHAILKALSGRASPAASQLGNGLGIGTGSAGLGRPVATPAKRVPGQKAVRTEEPAKQESGDKVVTRLSLCCMPTMVLTEFLEFLPLRLRPLLGETCKTLEEMTVAGGSTFRLSLSHSGSVPLPFVVRRVQRQAQLRVLDLSGFEALTAGSSKELAESLEKINTLNCLRLRGCKGLSDASVRRLLSSCTGLEVLDLLEIPRLSNKAVQIALPCLRFFAAGSLGRHAVNTKGTKHSENVGLMSSRLDVLGGKALPQNEAAEKPAHASLFTSYVFSQLMTTELGSGASPTQDKVSSLRAKQQKGKTSSRGGSNAAPPTRQENTSSAAAPAPPPLTHIVLAHCADIEVLPKLPPAIEHLDLRGARLQLPEAAVAGWRPLASCTHLQVLNLAGITTLSSRALLACIASLPCRTGLKVLDFTDTRLEAHVCSALPTQAPALTHLRLSNCLSVNNPILAELLRGLNDLEVLDIAGCAVEFPLSDLVPAAPVAGAARASLAAKLRLLGIGRTALIGPHLEFTRRALAIIAPQAEAVPGSLDIFRSYKALPPVLL